MRINANTEIELRAIFLNGDPHFYSRDSLTGEIEFGIGKNLDTAIEILISEDIRERNSFIEFNGQKIKSKNVSYDGVYLEMFGQTKVEFDKYNWYQLRKAEQEVEEQRKHAIEILPIQITRGFEYMPKAKRADWIKDLEADANGTYCGWITQSALTWMDLYKNDISQEEMLNFIYSEGHTGNTFSATKYLVKNFANFGPDICEFISREELSKDEKLELETIREKNLELIQDDKQDKRTGYNRAVQKKLIRKLYNSHSKI